MRTDEFSAFDLLQDIMCNTFGAVMFIALALLIVMASLPEDSAADIRQETSRRNIPARIEKEMYPVMLEQIRSAAAGVESLRKELAHRKSPEHFSGAVPADRNMQLLLPQMKISAEAPFFLVVKAGRVWRVGPGLDGKACSDVAASETPAGIRCTPIPGKGCPLGSELKDVPNGRLPVFILYPEGAEYFWHYRNGLKEDFIRHGLILKGEPEEDFVYALTRESVYEY